MDITLFLAQIWGPMILALALGIFVSRSYYIKLYRDLEKDTLAVLVFGMVAMAAGTAHIIFHNSWNTFTQSLISFMGWGLYIKGVLFIVTPKFVDRMGNRWVKNKLIPYVGGLMLLIGIYLTWIGYIA